MSKSPESTLKSQTMFAALAELVGTFFLTLAALTVAPPHTAYAVGLVLLVFVGSHLNPAVTVGLIASKRFPLIEGVFYIIAQIAGAFLARFIAGLGSVSNLTGDYKSAGSGAEFIGFGILMLTVAATTENKVSKSGSGIAVGGSLLAGLLLTKGVLNPAVALAMGLVASPAVWATLLSGIAFSWLFSIFERAKLPKTGD
jgi:aquaporin Z